MKPTTLSVCLGLLALRIGVVANVIPIDAGGLVAEKRATADVRCKACAAETRIALWPVGHSTNHDSNRNEKKQTRGRAWKINLPKFDQYLTRAAINRLADCLLVPASWQILLPFPPPLCTI